MAGKFRSGTAVRCGRRFAACAPRRKRIPRGRCEIQRGGVKSAFGDRQHARVLHHRRPTSLSLSLSPSKRNLAGTMEYRIFNTPPGNAKRGARQWLFLENRFPLLHLGSGVSYVDDEANRYSRVARARARASRSGHVAARSRVSRINPMETAWFLLRGARRNVRGKKKKKESNLNPPMASHPKTTDRDTVRNVRRVVRDVSRSLEWKSSLSGKSRVIQIDTETSTA